MSSTTEPVTYEAFGAVGDGVADDLPAICDAHAHANANGLPVRSRPDATYHLGRRALTAVIATDTEWSTSRFTIDDTDVEDHRASLFEVRSLLEPESLSIDRLERDQRTLDVKPTRDCYVSVQNEGHKIYIRRGLNENAGVPQRDCFILRNNGSIEGDIDWHYDAVTHVDASPIDDKPLTLRGGVLTTFANRMVQEVGYNYWARNIEVKRSNTTIEGLAHYVVGETAVGHPYRGFVNVSGCANITLAGCFFTGHKIYQTIGAAGKPVSMGSYDVSANAVVNFRMTGCRMNHILDRTRWGVIGTNHCKNIVLEDCTLSRMDTHMGVAGEYTVRRCELGHMGLNAIGRGTMTVEDCTLHGRTLVRFRSDYGSTWEGDLVIRNCKWIPACGDAVQPCLIGVDNDGTHDFGYPCSMPAHITLENVFVDDSHHPDGYEGIELFTNPDAIGGDDLADAPPAADRPFAYAPTQTVTLRGLTTATGKPHRVSPNAELAASVKVVGDA